MSFVAKTDWKHSDPISENDLNRWEAGIKAANDIKNEAQMKKLTQNTGYSISISNTDLNELKMTGFYYGSQMTNGPTGFMTGWVLVNAVTSSYCFQEYTNNVNSASGIRRFWRVFFNGTWTAWNEVASTALATQSAAGLQSSADKTAIDFAQKVKLTLDSGTNKSMPGSDANLVTEPGFYVTSTGAQNTAVTFGTLLHVARSAGTKLQVQWSSANGDTYVRSDNGTGWSNWKRITDNSILGGVLLGNKLVDTQTANFVGKVAGSTTANPHIFGRAGLTALTTPTNYLDSIQNDYTLVQSLDGSPSVYSSGLNSGRIPQHIFLFNLIEHVQRTYGTIPGATTTEKVAWLRSNITRLTFNWWGSGTSATGNKASFALWDVAGVWNAITSHTASSIQKLTIASTQMSLRIDSNGFVYALAYADASDSTVASLINTDYVDLQVELSTSIKDNMKPVWIDATLQNGWLEFTPALKPQYSLGFDGFVTLKGGVKSGALNATLMTLPAGFRPTQPSYFLVPGDTVSKSFFRITVQQDGQVLVVHFGGTSTSDFVSLDGVRFPTN